MGTDATDAEAQWPRRWRDRLFPITAIRFDGWKLWVSIGPEDWSGHCWAAQIGPWMLLGGTADMGWNNVAR